MTTQPSDAPTGGRGGALGTKSTETTTEETYVQDLGFRVYKLVAHPNPPASTGEPTRYAPAHKRTDRAARNSDLPYEMFRDLVISLGRNNGWLVDAIVDGKLDANATPGGAPLTMVQPERGMVIFAYLVCGQRPLRKHEYPWLDALQNLSDRTCDWLVPLREGDVMPMSGRRVRLYVWRPYDLGEIGRILMGIPADFSDWERWSVTASADADLEAAS